MMLAFAPFAASARFVPPRSSGCLRYEHTSFRRELSRPGRSSLKTSELPQGYGSGILLRLLRPLGKLDYAVNNILGHLVNVFACSLRHEGNIAIAGSLVNQGLISK